jgi:hypothetical protein
MVTLMLGKTVPENFDFAKVALLKKQVEND